MSPVTTQPFSDSGLNLGFFTIPTSFLLQVGTASILLLLLAERATLDNLQNFGEASEELLRGKRLPILNFPDQNELNRS